MSAIVVEGASESYAKRCTQDVKSSCRKHVSTWAQRPAIFQKKQLHPNANIKCLVCESREHTSTYIQKAFQLCSSKWFKNSLWLHHHHCRRRCRKKSLLPPYSWFQLHTHARAQHAYMRNARHQSESCKNAIKKLPARSKLNTLVFFSSFVLHFYLSHDFIFVFGSSVLLFFLLFVFHLI